MADVNDPDIGVLDKIMDPVRISPDEAAPQFRGSSVANSEMRSLRDKRDRIENRPNHPIRGAGFSLAM
jgi:hypothetical protein